MPPRTELELSHKLNSAPLCGGASSTLNRCLTHDPMDVKGLRPSKAGSLSELHRIGFVVLACVQNGLFGGLIYGWAAIDDTMLAAKPEDGGAGLTFSQATRIFSMASSVGMWSSLPLGLILDRFGPRACSAVAHLCLMLGCLVFATANSIEMVTLAMALLAFGGPGITSSIVHLANLFPENRCLALSCMNGTISISFGVFAVLGSLWEKYEALSFHTLFGAYAVCVALSLVASLSCWPDKSFEAQDVASTEVDALLLQPTIEDIPLASPMSPVARLGQSSERKVELKDESFRRQLTSGTHLRILAVFVVSSFLANFYIAQLSMEMADTRHFTPDERHSLSSFLTLMMAAGFFWSILVGFLLDYIGLEPSSILTMFFAQVHLVILIFLQGNEKWMVLGFVSYVLYRQFLFPVYMSSLTGRLGFKFFGLLVGIGFATSGLAQGFMSAIVESVQGDCHLVTDPDLVCDAGNWTALHCVELVVVSALLLAPVYEHIQIKRQQRPKVEGFSTYQRYGSMRTTYSDADSLRSVQGVELYT